MKYNKDYILENVPKHVRGAVFTAKLKKLRDASNGYELSPNVIKNLLEDSCFARSINKPPYFQAKSQKEVIEHASFTSAYIDSELWWEQTLEGSAFWMKMYNSYCKNPIYKRN